MRGLARLLSRAEHKGTKGLPMASSLESNKIAAAVLTAGVLAMLSGFVAELIYHPHVELAENAYPITIPEDTGGSGAPAQEEEVLEPRSEEHTSELQSLMRISYAVFCLKKKKTPKHTK